jgi:hypothetical protein
MVVRKAAFKGRPQSTVKTDDDDDSRLVRSDFSVRHRA